MRTRKLKTTGVQIAQAEGIGGLLQRGTPTIINDVDAPCVKLIAIVTSLIKYSDGRIQAHARYLSKNLKGEDSFCYGPAKNATPLLAFGLRLVLDRETKLYTTIGVGECIATYAHGNPRHWQEYGCPIGPYRAEVAKILQKQCFDWGRVEAPE